MKLKRNLVCLHLLFRIIRKREHISEQFIEKTEKDIEDEDKRYNFCPKCGYQSYEKGVCQNCNKELVSPTEYSKNQEIEIHGNSLEDLEYSYEQGLISEEKYQELKAKILEKMKERNENAEENVNSEIEAIKREQFREIQDSVPKDKDEFTEEDFFEEREFKKEEDTSKSLEKQQNHRIICPKCNSVNLTFYEGNSVRCNDCKKVFVKRNYFINKTL